MNRSSDFTPKFKPGDKVIFNGQDEHQRRWGGNDDANLFLTVGQEYVIESVAAHSWHTKLRLRYIDGRFNSVCFGLTGSEL